MKKPHRAIAALLVTAGPTREKIDPVRFISNYSTGVFGYAIAREAKRRGLRVTLISGPTCLDRPAGVHVIDVESAADMQRAVLRHLPQHTCLIMAAAVADWRPSAVAVRKRRREGAPPLLRLVPTADIVAAAVRRKRPGTKIVGFALETEHLVRNARHKMQKKGLDLIIANRVGGGASPFGDARTTIRVLCRDGRVSSAITASKQRLAKIVLDNILNDTI